MAVAKNSLALTVAGVGSSEKKKISWPSEYDLYFIRKLKSEMLF